MSTFPVPHGHIRGTVNFLRSSFFLLFKSSIIKLITVNFTSVSNFCFMLVCLMIVSTHDAECSWAVLMLCFGRSHKNWRRWRSSWDLEVYLKTSWILPDPASPASKVLFPPLQDIKKILKAYMVSQEGRV